MVAFLTADKHLPLIKRSVIPRALFDDPASTGTVLAATGQTTPESNVMDFTGDNLAPTDDTEIPDDSNVQGDIYVIFPKVILYSATYLGVECLLLPVIGGGRLHFLYHDRRSQVQDFLQELQAHLR